MKKLLCLLLCCTALTAAAGAKDKVVDLSRIIEPVDLNALFDAAPMKSLEETNLLSKKTYLVDSEDNMVLVETVLASPDERREGYTPRLLISYQFVKDGKIVASKTYDVWYQYKHVSGGLPGHTDNCKIEYVEGYLKEENRETEGYLWVRDVIREFRNMQEALEGTRFIEHMGEYQLQGPDKLYQGGITIKATCMGDLLMYNTADKLPVWMQGMRLAADGFLFINDNYGVSAVFLLVLAGLTILPMVFFGARFGLKRLGLSSYETDSLAAHANICFVVPLLLSILASIEEVSDEAMYVLLLVLLAGHYLVCFVRNKRHDMRPFVKRGIMVLVFVQLFSAAEFFVFYAFKNPFYQPMDAVVKLTANFWTAGLVALAVFLAQSLKRCGRPRKAA